MTFSQAVTSSPSDTPSQNIQVTPNYPEPISLELIISDIDVLGVPTTIYRNYPLDEETYPLLKSFMTEQDKLIYREWRRKMAIAYLSAQREKIILAQAIYGF